MKPSMSNDAPLSNFQAISGQASAFALGPNGNKLLNEQLGADEQPTENSRRLEIALLWGDTVIDVRAYAPGQAVKIGPTPAADFRVYEEGLPETFDLVSENTIRVPAGSKMAVYREGRERTDAGSGPLALSDRALVTVGTTHFIVRWIKPAARSKTGFFDSVDFYFTKVLSVAFMIHLVLFVGFWITPLNNDLLSEDLFKNPSALVKTSSSSPIRRRSSTCRASRKGPRPRTKKARWGRKRPRSPRPPRPRRARRSSMPKSAKKTARRS